MREDWLSPNLFEALNALSEIDDDNREHFLYWCRQNGYDIATDDVGELAVRYRSLYEERFVPQEEPPDEENSPYLSGYPFYEQRYATYLFDDEYD